MPGTTQWVYFAALAGTGVLFLLLAFFIFLPMIILAPSKFAITFSLGSALIIASLGALKGWREMFGHMASKERLPFTAGETEGENLREPLLPLTFLLLYFLESLFYGSP